MISVLDLSFPSNPGQFFISMKVSKIRFRQVDRRFQRVVAGCGGNHFSVSRTIGCADSAEARRIEILIKFPESSGGKQSRTRPPPSLRILPHFHPLPLPVLQSYFHKFSHPSLEDPSKKTLPKFTFHPSLMHTRTLSFLLSFIPTIQFVVSYTG